MVFGLIIDFSAGVLCIVLGLLLWLKQKISILHSYHCKNVKQEDVPAYTRLMGIGLIIIGAGICGTGAVSIFNTKLFFIPLIIGIAAGIAVMHVAQKKYNGSWFS